MQILKLLATKGPLSYTEIMFSLKLDPVRDAGRFVYHLKSIVEGGLVDVDKETKNYGITELGRMVVNFARDVEEYVAVRKGKLYVRTSRFAIEEFDRDKIVGSLSNEAGLPFELAQEIAAEAEERLLRLKTTYLTAPLIREFVNAILIERKLEEYRHKLTRLGMPVYDVTQLFKTASEQMLDVDAVKDAAGYSVMGEYVLLDSLPREVADSHLSGLIHLDSLPNWVLKPSEIQHDCRYFFKNGIPTLKAPQTFEAALALLQNVHRLSKAEISGEQSFDMFNVFLAPFAKGLAHEQLRENLSIFFAGLREDVLSHQAHSGLSLGFEFGVPDFFLDVEAIGQGGVKAGVYGDYVEEANLILELSLEAAIEASSTKPLFNPRFILKLRDHLLQDDSAKKNLLKAHELAAKFCAPYFLSLGKSSKITAMASGMQLNDDWSGYWETDCIRTGCADTVFLNLPRQAYESDGNDSKFFSLLETSVKTAIEAFKVKKKALNERLRQNLLPLLKGFGEGSPYFYDRNASYALSFIGLNEAVSAHTGASLPKDEESLKFALRIVREISSYAKSFSRESNIRFAVAQRPGDDAACRLAELDVEKYGLSATVIEGSKGHPHYTDLFALPLSSKISLEERVRIESEVQTLTTGGCLASICLTPVSHSPKALLRMTQDIVRKGLRFFTYTNNYSYCMKCEKAFVGMLSKCPNCGTDSLTYYGRSSATYTPTVLWPDSKRRSLEKRICYSLP